MDGLCELNWRRGEAAQALQWGRKSLDAKHTLALQNGDVQPTEMAKRYANVASDLKVIGFSLFGHEAFYAEAAVRNAQDVAQHYPDWVCRFYVGPEVSSAIKLRLHQAGAEVVSPPQAQAHLPGTVWRFLAIDDLRVSTVMMRDADSLITNREVAAVQQWLDSGKSFHVIRDHAMHTELMLAGLWGARTKQLRGIGQALLTFFAKPFHPTHADQHFLRDWVWPRVWSDVVQHDAVLNWHAQGMHAPIGLVQDQQEHIGHAPTQWTHLDAPPALSNAMQIRYQLWNESAQVLGEFVAARQSGGFSIRLPPHVLEKIQAGQWQLKALLEP